MTGAGVPVLKAERSQKGIVTMCGSSSGYAVTVTLYLTPKLYL